MEEIQKILGILLSNKTNDSIIDKLGVLNKIVGRIHVLVPIIDGVQNIGLVIDQNKIHSISFILKEPVAFTSLKKNFSVDYSFFYNHHDEDSVLSFPFSKNLTFRAIKEGYIEEANLLDYSFTRFEIDVK